MREKKEFNPNLVQFGTVFVTKKFDRSLLGPEDQDLVLDNQTCVVIKIISEEDMATLDVMNPNEPKNRWEIHCISGSSSFQYIDRVIDQLSLEEIMVGVDRFVTDGNFASPKNIKKMIEEYQEQSTKLDFSH